MSDLTQEIVETWLEGYADKKEIATIIARHLAAEEQARAERDAEVANTIDYIIREEGWQMCETHVDMLKAALALLSEAKEATDE